MAINYFYPDYEVVRNPDRCVACRVCERQCANEVHHYDEDLKRMIADDSKCVNCHRCVSLCPTKALKIVKTDHTFKENANWSNRPSMRSTARRKAAAYCFPLWVTPIRTLFTGIKSSSTPPR